MSIRGGFFVVLDGIDGCGKSLHSRLLNEELLAAGYRTFRTMEPSNGVIGRFIRHSLLRSQKTDPEIEALLFAADRFDHLHYEILPSLKRGRVVVSDRYFHSSLAYQGAQGVDLDWIRELNSFAIKPDLSIYLDLPPDIGLQRKRGPSSVLEKFELQKKVREAFLQLASSGEMILVDANGPINDVKQRILSITLNALRDEREKAAYSDSSPERHDTPE